MNWIVLSIIGLGIFIFGMVAGVIVFIATMNWAINNPIDREGNARTLEKFYEIVQERSKNG